MADGRLLWRVFDNLMNNICKYAQPGTRVYLTIEVQNSEAVISFKNTSRYALDIPADELMERFVRSDRSRSTEGNGLGLSIAQSLMELQKAKLELVVDGDLFKVTLKFNTI
jgi:signal transduction histidine kinase